MSESIAALTGMVVRIPMVFLAVAIAGTVIQPTMIKSLQNRIAVLLGLLTIWFMMCIPFSVHRGGSVRMLMGYWLTTIMGCFCVMVLGQHLFSIRRLLYAIVAGVLLVMLLGMATSSNPELRNVLGGMNNPNLYGQQLLYALPFLFIPVFLHGLFSFRGLVASAGSALILLKVVFTGSRASFLAIAVVLALLFLRMTFMNRMVMAAASLPTLVIVYMLMPQLAKDRYATILLSNGETVQSIDAVGAMQSAESRKIHFQQSIELTFRNPVFGVGPGMFPVASADYSVDIGEKAYWKETHNTYSQISSESGFPGFLLYIGMLAATIMAQRKTMALARGAPNHSPLAECGIIAFCLFLSTAATIVTGTFSSIGYQIYFPLLGAFSIAVLQLATQITDAARSQQATIRPQQRQPQPSPPKDLRPLAYPRGRVAGNFAE